MSSYTINKSNGDAIPVAEGSINNTSTSLVLIGKNYAGYGAFLNDNFVKLLENFSNNTSPANPIKGQLWWDTTNNILKVYSGTSWKISTGATASPFSSPPGDLSALGGDLWFDTTNSQLKVYSGANWITVGPQTLVGVADTGAFPAIMTDTSSPPSTHVVVQFKINGTIYAILSHDPQFPTAVTGFATIKPGLNFSTTNVPSMGLNTQDTAATASTIVQRTTNGGVVATDVTSTTVTTGTVTATAVNSPNISGTLTGNVVATRVTATGISANTITAGSDGIGGISGTILTASQPNIIGLGNVVNLNATGTINLTGYATYNGLEISTTSGGTLTLGGGGIQATPIGTTQPNVAKFTTVTITNSLVPAANLVINLGASNNGWWNNIYGNTITVNSGVVGGSLSVAGALTSTGTTSFNNTSLLGATTVTGNIVPTSTLLYNLGSQTNQFNTVYGKSIQAQYADIAERFEADAAYAPGTVVEMGGPAEITKVVADLSDKVFGVISTNAAYLMNSTAGTDATHPPVAMSGRVPVRAVGLIAKGDRLVSAGNGLARAGQAKELTPWNVIGRSLVDKTYEGEGIIEAIVKINS
jgi:hypothetical protein